MNLNILFSIVFLNIIGYSLLQKYYAKPDLKKYDKITVDEAGTGTYNERYIIFDSSDFKEGDNMYFKITMTEFYDEYIYYEFFDDPNAYEPNLGNPSRVLSNRKDYNYDYGVYSSETRYYTIKKDSRNLGSLEGKYLTIYFYGYGNALIENYKKSNTVLIVVIVIVVIVVIVGIIFLIYYCIKRKRRLAQYNMGNNVNNGYQNNNNVNVQNNYGLQQGQFNGNQNVVYAYDQNANVYNNNNNNIGPTVRNLGAPDVVYTSQ